MFTCYRFSARKGINTKEVIFSVQDALSVLLFLVYRYCWLSDIFLILIKITNISVSRSVCIHGKWWTHCPIFNIANNFFKETLQFLLLCIHCKKIMSLTSKLFIIFNHFWLGIASNFSPCYFAQKLPFLFLFPSAILTCDFNLWFFIFEPFSVAAHQFVIKCTFSTLFLHQ